MNRTVHNTIQLVQDIQQSAILYKQNLVGRKFLYIFEGRWIEVIYTIYCYKHLTGVESNLSAGAFFNDAVNQRLSIHDISFNRRHPYALAIRKIQHLNKLPTLATNEGFFLQDVRTRAKIILQFRLPESAFAALSSVAVLVQILELLNSGQPI